MTQIYTNILNSILLNKEYKHIKKPCKHLYLQGSSFFLRGMREIRTLGTVTRTTVFETVPFGHSGIIPFPP